MKWILLLLPTITFAYDFIPEIRLKPESDLVEYKDEGQSFAGDEWAPYLNDSCTMYDRNVQNEDDMRSVGLRRCKDGSVSFVQPASDGWNGWEGKCGQTAASNSLYHLCKKALDPNVYVARYTSDSTPGVRPKTLRNGLSAMFKDNKDSCPKTNQWFYNHQKSTLDFIALIKQDLLPKYSHPNLLKIERNGQKYFRNPVVILIQNPGGNYLHWVTIVDTFSANNTCQFVVNHWNRQYTVPCELVSQWSGKVGKTYPVILKSYSTVTYK